MNQQGLRSRRMADPILRRGTTFRACRVWAPVLGTPGASEWGMLNAGSHSPLAADHVETAAAAEHGLYGPAR